MATADVTLDPIAPRMLKITFKHFLVFKYFIRSNANMNATLLTRDLHAKTAAQDLKHSNDVMRNFSVREYTHPRFYPNAQHGSMLRMPADGTWPVLPMGRWARVPTDAAGALL
eukprot:1160445-Pelagomonas_calceolata.AAC.1